MNAAFSSCRACTNGVAAGPPQRREQRVDAVAGVAEDAVTPQARSRSTTTSATNRSALMRAQYPRRPHPRAPSRRERGRPGSGTRQPAPPSPFRKEPPVPLSPSLAVCRSAARRHGSTPPSWSGGRLPAGAWTRSAGAAATHAVAGRDPGPLVRWSGAGPTRRAPPRGGICRPAPRMSRTHEGPPLREGGGGPSPC